MLYEGVKMIQRGDAADESLVIRRVQQGSTLERMGQSKISERHPSTKGKNRIDDAVFEKHS